MTDEIKEILEQLEWYKKIGEKDIMFPEHLLTNKKVFLLLDYITNLQEDIRIGQEINSELQQEIERLQENNSNMQEEMARVWEENERLNLELSGYREAILRDDKLLGLQDYKSRCEKAIEKINYYKYFISLTKLEEHMLNTLDNILQNGSDEE